MAMKRPPAGLGIHVRALALPLVAFCSAILIFGGNQPASGSWGEGTEIHEAAKAGDVARLKALLAKDAALINLRDEKLMTPLHYAIQAKRLAAAEFLLANGADIRAANDEQLTPLHLASSAGDAAAVKLLLGRGADPKLRDMRGRPPLFLACVLGNNLEAVRLLIAAGADVNDLTPRGEHILVSTLFNGKKEIIDFLLDSGARIPDDQRTITQAIYVSASNGVDRVFKLAVEMADRKGLAWWKGVPLHAPARSGSVAIAEALLAKGGELDQKDAYGVTPLHIAAENGRKEFVDFLLARGAKIDEPTRMGKTALHLAEDNGHVDVAALLKAKGASPAPPRFPELRGPYLGQPEPGDTPKRFALGIVSGHGFDSEHSPVAFSPDGKEASWTPKFKGPMLFMRQENSVWTPPGPVSFGSSQGDGEPIFSPDGKRLYFLSLRPLEPGGASDKENIWYVERTASGWSEPRPVSPLVNAFNHHWLFSVSNDGTLCFSSVRDGGIGGRDIYRSRLINGSHEQPRNIGPVINTKGEEHMPYIAPDESYLIFVSTGHPPAAGQFHFFISYRGGDGSWTTPVSLGEKIHTVQQGLCPLVTPDGKYMFFIGQGDIWWVDAGFIEALRPKKSSAP
jgi:ankyrin repeat protein